MSRTEVMAITEAIEMNYMINKVLEGVQDE
jgi:hypothetical protein